MNNAMLALLKDAKHMTTIVYTSKPRLLKGKLSETPLLGAEIECVARLQVNPFRQYKKAKAKAEGVPVSEVKIAPRPGWNHISPNMVEKDGVIMFQAAPVKRLNTQYMVDGKVATKEQTEMIEGCMRAANKAAVQLRTYRLDRIKRATTDGQTVEVYR